MPSRSSCANRAFRSLRNPEAFRDLDLFQVIRQGKAGLVAANLALSAFQRRLAEQFGIEPGAEMKAAIDGAEARGLPVWLIDREVGVTLEARLSQRRFPRPRSAILGGLWREPARRAKTSSEDEIEKLKQGDLLGSMFSEFAKRIAAALRSADRRTRPLHDGAPARGSRAPSGQARACRDRRRPSRRHRARTRRADRARASRSRERLSDAAAGIAVAEVDRDRRCW